MNNNSYLIKITAALMCTLHFSCALASEDVILQKYTYGYPYSSEERRNKAMIDPLPGADLTLDGKVGKIYSYYSLSEEGNSVMQKKKHIYAHLLVQNRGHDIVAKVGFYNRSHQTYYIHKSRLAIDDPEFYPLYGHAFSIASDGVSSYYLGHRWHFDDEVNESRDGWEEIPARKIYSFTIKLNAAYAFLPGRHHYNIGSLEYSIVNKQWFVDQEIYKNLFSILALTYFDCQVKKDEPYVLKVNELCTLDDSSDISIGEFLYNLGFHGFDPNNYFEIRTNQVVIDIDGDKLTSPYDDTEGGGR